MVFISVMVLGVALWALQRLWVRGFGGKNISLIKTCLYSWGALLDHPPFELALSPSGQVLC